MRQYLPYIMWVSRLGLLATSLFFVDYFLPYRELEERITEIYAVRINRSVAYHIILTDSGRKLKLYDFQADRFREEATVRSTLTPLYGTIMYVANHNGTFVERLAYMYRYLVFWPIILFVNSLLAVLFHARVELCFNLNLTGIILLVVNVVLI